MICKVFLIVLLSWSVLGGNFPPELSKCKHEDSDCIVGRMNEIFQTRSKGYSGLNLQQFEPLTIPKMSLKQGGLINIDLNFKNVDLRGMHKATAYKATGFKSDPDKNKLDIRFRAPVLSVTGPYKIKGSVFFLPITGNGMSNLTLENIDITMRFLTKKIEKNGKTYMSIEKKKLFFDSSRLRINLDNLLNNKENSDTMNNFLNNNEKIVLKEVKTSISEAFAGYFADVINGVMTNIPYSEMFLD